MSWLDFLTKLVPFIKVLISQIELPQTSFKKNLTLNLMFACVVMMFLLTVLMIEQAIIQADSKYDNMKQNESTHLASPTIPTVEVPKNCGPLKVEVPIALREIPPPPQTEGLSEADRIVNLENRIRILAIHYEKHRVKLKSQIDEYNASCK